MKDLSFLKATLVNAFLLILLTCILVDIKQQRAHHLETNEKDQTSPKSENLFKGTSSDSPNSWRIEITVTFHPGEVFIYFEVFFTLAIMKLVLI